MRTAKLGRGGSPHDVDGPQPSGMSGLAKAAVGLLSVAGVLMAVLLVLVPLMAIRSCADTEIDTSGLGEAIALSGAGLPNGTIAGPDGRVQVAGWDVTAVWAASAESLCGDVSVARTAGDGAPVDVGWRLSASGPQTAPSSVSFSAAPVQPGGPARGQVCFPAEARSVGGTSVVVWAPPGAPPGTGAAWAL